MTTAQINTINRNKSAQLNFIYVDTTNHQYPIYYIGLQDGTLKQQTTTSASIGAITPLSIVSLSPLFTASVNTTSTSQDIIFAQIPQAANTFYGGPTSGLDANPTFRILTTADLPAGTGTVTNFSAGNLSPLFTTSVATPTTTPVLSFTLNTQTANTIFAGPTTGAAATPTFRSLVAADISGIAWLLNGNTTGNDTTWLGTIDNRDFLFKTNNTERFSISKAGAVSSKLGYWLDGDKFFYRDSGGSSVSIGKNSGNSLPDSSIVTIGHDAGASLTAGAESCILIGDNAGTAITNGPRNVAIGTNAGGSLDTGTSCVLMGWHAGALISGVYGLTTAIGYDSLSTAIYGSNTAIGYSSGAGLTTGYTDTFLGYGTSTSKVDAIGSIAIGHNATVTADNQLMIGSAGTPITNAYIGTSVAQPDANLFVGSLNLSPGINTTAGDSATINKTAGRFRKDTTGTTFTLTNSYITANSIILLTLVTAGLTTGNQLSVVAGAGSATITFETAGVAAAPSANADVNFLIIN